EAGGGRGGRGRGAARAPPGWGGLVGQVTRRQGRADVALGEGAALGSRTRAPLSRQRAASGTSAVTTSRQLPQQLGGEPPPGRHVADQGGDLDERALDLAQGAPALLTHLAVG